MNEEINSPMSKWPDQQINKARLNKQKTIGVWIWGMLVDAIYNHPEIFLYVILLASSAVV